jgi:protein SCO1/2
LHSTERGPIFDTDIREIVKLNLRIIALTLAFCAPGAVIAQDSYDQGGWDQDSALAYSQAAVGGIIGDYAFTGSDGQPVSLHAFRGKPLLVSMVFTSCHHVCPTTTRRLAQAVRAAREVLGDDSFSVVTIGFDTVNDTPSAMRTFARQQSVQDMNWAFLSATSSTIEALAEDLGFIYFASPRGFDHLTQVSVIDRDGRLYRQVYGMQFELPWLVEPLKELVLNRPQSAHQPLSGLLDRIRLFCTVYDPASDRYYFDYSLFIQMAIGLAAILAVGIFLFRGMRRRAQG